MNYFSLKILSSCLTCLTCLSCLTCLTWISGIYSHTVIHLHNVKRQLIKTIIHLPLILLLKPLRDSNLVDGFVCSLSRHGIQRKLCFILLGMLFVSELSAGFGNCRLCPHVFGALTQVVVSIFSCTDAMQILFSIV